jgi:uncharacterized protein YndB with AHSA1/START domain
MTPKPELETRSFEVQVEIDATPEMVWKAVSEGEEIAKWLAPEVRVEPGVGGSILCSWGPGMEGTMKIEAWEPNRHLTLVEYRDKPYGCGPSDASSSGEEGVPRRIATDYYIEAKEGGGTVLRLVHSGFGPSAEWDGEIESLSRGWPTFFRVMKHGIERHPGEPARNIPISATSQLTPEETWERLMGPGGLRLNPEIQYGAILLDGHRQFAAVISNWNEALCSLVCEGVPGKPGSSIYWMLTVYSIAPEKAEALQTKWTEFLQRLFA